LKKNFSSLFPEIQERTFYAASDPSVPVLEHDFLTVAPDRRVDLGGIAGIVERELGNILVRQHGVAARSFTEPVGLKYSAFA